MMFTMNDDMSVSDMDMSSINLVGNLNIGRSVFTFDTDNNMGKGSLIIAQKLHGIGVSAYDNMRNTFDMSYYVLPSWITIFRMKMQDSTHDMMMSANLRGKFYNAQNVMIEQPMNAMPRWAGMNGTDMMNMEENNTNNGSVNNNMNNTMNAPENNTNNGQINNSTNNNLTGNMN